MVKKIITIPCQSDSFAGNLLKVVMLLLLSFLYSCNDDAPEINTTDRLFIIQLGDKNYKVVNKSVGAAENCGRLSIGFVYDQPDGHFAIDFDILKNGSLHKATLVDFALTGGQNRFETADFNPVALMKITNFKYDEATKYVHFEYSGEVIQVQYNPDDAHKTFPRKYIQGVVTINDLDTSQCNAFLPTMQFETPALVFTTTYSNGTSNTSLSSNPYFYRFYANNGYRAIFNLKDDFWDFEKGKTYNFDQSTIENRIDFQQYIGRLRATQTYDYAEIDWEKYQTAGNYTILEHKIVNGIKVTKGEMNLQVYDNGVLIHNIVKGSFEGRSF